MPQKVYNTEWAKKVGNAAWLKNPEIQNELKRRNEKNTIK